MILIPSIMQECNRCNQCNKHVNDLNHNKNNHIAEIVPSLFIGSYAMVNSSELEYNKITDVINTAYEVYYNLDKKYSYFLLPLKDSPNQHLIEYLDEICEYIHMLINNSCKVLVHCYMGISNSSSIIIAYLIKYHNMDCDQALLYVRNKRYVNPNDRFISDLKEYHKKISRQ